MQYTEEDLRRRIEENLTKKPQKQNEFEKEIESMMQKSKIPNPPKPPKGRKIGRKPIKIKGGKLFLITGYSLFFMFAFFHCILTENTYFEIFIVINLTASSLCILVALCLYIYKNWNKEIEL